MTAESPMSPAAHRESGATRSAADAGSPAPGRFDAGTLAATATRLRTPVQLAGFLFAALAAALIRYVDPGNLQSLGIAGAIGVALVAIPLIFQPAMLRLLQPSHRLALILGTLSILLASFGALAVITAQAILRDLSPAGARFDTRLDAKDVRVILRRPDGSGRVEVVWQLVPLSMRAQDSARIFTGIVTFHDEDLARAGPGQAVRASCEQVASCVGSRVFSEWADNPVFVRAGATRGTLTASVDLKRVPKNLRVWWEFYQREGTDGATCDFAVAAFDPAQGIPRLAQFDRQHQRVSDRCYRSYGQRTFPLKGDS